MKSFLFLILFLLFIPNLFSQNSAIADYGVVFSTTLVDDKLKLEDPDFYEHQLAKENSADKLKFVLKINKSESLFFHPTLKESSDALKFAKSNTGGDHLIYINLEEQILLNQFPYWGSEILLQEKLNNTPWVIENSSRTISGFVCFKAVKTFSQEEGGYTREHKVEAWFAPEIPLKFGPKGYAGLPGLIIELTENNVTFFLKELKYADDKDLTLERPSDGIKMSKEDFADQSLKLKNRAKQAIKNSRG
ncbi:GLPGLI family protein [Antarcticibacterium arcticum]|uniref:GLPGLI family protein n=1 Tax=Antarcticibacterium arcticum TaxID=2585771 RepID=A0A5B8YM19_9FLAO|nr:GLPGLI family protein [Antarcticibacterium arcticum]QED38962.1 GLPGLI family protein [Antarcticibacterium arcticum]